MTATIGKGKGMTPKPKGKAKKMQELTYKEIIGKHKSGTICSMTTFTPVKANVNAKDKSGRKNPYGEIRKRSTFTTHLGIADYEGLVNKHRTAEGLEADFEASKAWYVKESPAFGRGKKNGKGVAIVNDAGMTVQETHHFTADGTELVGESLDDFKANFVPERKDTYAKQGTDALVKVRAIYLDNVESITIGGVTYR